MPAALWETDTTTEELRDALRRECDDTERGQRRGCVHIYNTFLRQRGPDVFTTANCGLTEQFVKNFISTSRN